MVSFSNGRSSSGDVMNKRPTPKYKPRKVSAVRDFPPGCGRFVVPVIVKTEENGDGGSFMREANGVGTSNLMKTVVVKNSETSRIENNGVRVSEIGNDMDDGSIGNSKLKVECGESNEMVNSRIDTDISESLGTSVEKVTASAFAVDERVMEIGQTHEIINNPIQLERAESLEVLVGQVTIETLENLSIDADELTKESTPAGTNLLKSDSPKESAQVDLVNNSEVRELNEVEGSALVQKSLSPVGRMTKDKYRRRKVSAIRDFPPNCGPMVISRNDFPDNIKKVETVPEASMSRNNFENPLTSQKVSPAGIVKVYVRKETETFKKESNTKKTEAQTASGSGVMSKAVFDNVEDAREEFGNEIVIYSPDSSNNNKVNPQRNDFSSTDELHREEVVHGLMAEPNYPWSKGKVTLNNSDGGGKMRNQKGKFKSVAVSGNHKSEASSKKKKEFLDSLDADNSSRSLTFIDDENYDAYNENICKAIPLSTFKPGFDYINEGSEELVRNEIVVYSPDETDDKIMALNSVSSSGDEINREIMHSLMAEPYNAKRKEKVVTNYSDGGKEVQKQNNLWRKMSKAVTKKSTLKGSFSGGQSKKRKGVITVPNDENALILADEDLPIASFATQKTKKKHFDIRLPPFGPNTHNNGDARNKVRETLRLFHTICRKLLQNEEANSVPDGEGKLKEGKSGKNHRIDLQAAKVIKEKGKEVNTEKQFLGQVPGVEVGDEFQYRVELAIVGIHRLYQAGIDWIKINGEPVALSIVASGGYGDDMENADVLKYSGQGGNVMGKSKQPEDQKLERGNLALSNCEKTRTPVRVVRGWKETKAFDPMDSKSKIVTTYVYDGLYTVEKYWTETGGHGKLVFMFELRRNPGQPELAWKELKKSSKFKTRPGVCVTDISGGKEPFPVCAVNILNDEKPPPFNYISKMMYPDWYRPVPPVGCDCVGRCADSNKCRCAVKNGGGIPYNRNGAIVEMKHLIYECGPHCKCPPSCYNRVTQRGIKFKLEIFKTESRGWGIRSLTSVPSGSFICEYAGELLEDTEAERRVDNDEYLFDIGQNYNDYSEQEEVSVELTEEGGYTIDAAKYGNIGRFINHSCSPNLYAQYVISDHDDKKMPHVMLFAAENIPPLKELTYHYNYKVDQVCDSNGNVKIKNCYCGSVECTGRMY